MGPEQSNDPEYKAGGSIATDKVTQAGPVEGDDPDKKDTTVIQVGGWAWW